MSPDFSQSRVIFIAKSFNPYQHAALGFKELPIELWKYALFENNISSVAGRGVSEKNIIMMMITRRDNNE